MTKTILVTGITGKSGSYFFRILETRYGELDYKFRFVVRASSDTSFLNSTKFAFEKVIGDLEDEEFLNEAFHGVESVLHIAGIFWSSLLVKVALKNHIKDIILVHTTGIYSKYKSASEEYLSIEKEIQDMVSDVDISLTILRPTMIYGSHNDGNISIFIKMVDKLRIFPIVNHGRYKLQPVNQKDLGLAYFQVLQNRETTSRKNYILSGSNPIDLVDILKSISQYLDKKTIFLPVPYCFAYFVSVFIWIISFSKFDFREKVQRLVEERDFDHQDATKDFGYDPQYFLEGLKNQVIDYKLKK